MALFYLNKMIQKQQNKLCCENCYFNQALLTKNSQCKPKLVIRVVVAHYTLHKTTMRICELSWWCHLFHRSFEKCTHYKLILKSPSIHMDEALVQISHNYTNILLCAAPFEWTFHMFVSHFSSAFWATKFPTDGQKGFSSRRKYQTECGQCWWKTWPN